MAISGILLGVVALAYQAYPRLEARAAFFMENLEAGPNERGFYGSGTQRLAMWKVSVAMIKDAPLTGHGLEAFPDSMQPWADRLGIPVRFGIDGMGHGGYVNPHNQYLGWAATLGLPTAIALMLLFGAVPLWLAPRMIRASRPPPESPQAVHWEEEVTQTLIALRILLGLLAVYCLTESVIERQRGIIWFLTWITLIFGTLVTQCSMSRPERDPPRARESA